MATTNAAIQIFMRRIVIREIPITKFQSISNQLDLHTFVVTYFVSFLFFLQSEVLVELLELARYFLYAPFL